jgi:hypothetical protein
MRRSVSFVERVELQFKGNVFSQALCLGDVDNDGRSELVVGNVQGDLAIFKEEERNKPWRSCQDLGSVAKISLFMFKANEQFSYRLLVLELEIFVRLDKMFWSV